MSKASQYISKIRNIVPINDIKIISIYHFSNYCSFYFVIDLISIIEIIKNILFKLSFILKARMKLKFIRLCKFNIT